MHTDPALRVLIVDDDRIDRALCKRCLQESIWEFEFAEAESVSSGIATAQSWRPDCILLDFNMPDGDGLDVLEHLKLPTGSPCAVVMLTAYGGEELAVKAMKAGATDYLPKGRISNDILPRTVVHAIQAFRMHQQIEEQRSALSTSQRRYQELLEAMPQMVWTANADGRIEYVNRRWVDYTGLDAAQAALAGWDYVLYPEDRQPTWDAWKKATAEGSVLEIEHRLRRASDNDYRWHLVRAVPMRSATGEITSWLGTCTEIEDQKRAGDAAHEEQKVMGIGRLAGGVAHDFNNLLVCILGEASCAMERLPASHPAQEMLQGVLQAGERLAELTRRMLAYAGKATVCVEPTDIDQLVLDACESIRRSIPRNIHIEIRGGIDLPPAKTDSTHLRQAIVDLIMNAVEAIGHETPGRISVSTKTVEIESQPGGAPSGPALPSGPYIALEVRDTGCGMDEETRAKMFDPFFTTKFMGRGLGLAAVQGFVRSSGGSVQVESKPGQGTAFRIFLPVATEALSQGVAG